MIEPQWGVVVLQQLNGWVSSSALYHAMAAGLADYPIFLIPLFLLWIYVGGGIIKKYSQAKYAALLILCVAIVAVAINLGLQDLIVKARPETVLTGAGHLVMKHLPTASFPSDHAAVSMGVAIAALIRAHVGGKKKILIIRGWILFVSSLIMSIARVAVGVHWPTDILAGWGVGIISALLVFFLLKPLLERYILRYVIRFEEWFLGLFGVYRK